MKSLLKHVSLKTVYLFVILGVLIGSYSIGQARSSDPSVNGVRPFQVFPAQGYLMVYSATDEFDDGGILFHAHSSYVIYRSDGRFIRNVENHITLSDEIPELVRLAPGAYTVEARSENSGYVRVSVVINPERLTVVTLDSGVNGVPTSAARKTRPARPGFHDFAQRENVWE